MYFDEQKVTTDWRWGDDFPVRFYGNSDTSSGSVVHVLHAKAFFVNTTLKNKLKEEYKNKHRFIGRFPIEPFVDEFIPNAHNINSTGWHQYRAILPNSYKGFGIYPNWKDAFPWKEHNVVKYQAPITNTKDRNKIIVDFPAEAQLFPGEYQLIVVAEIFDPGYKNSSRMVTMNLNGVFELVSDSEEADVDGAVQIEINNTDVESTDPIDVYVESGSYDSGSIRLDRTDNTRVNIDVSPITGWYEGE